MASMGKVGLNGCEIVSLGVHRPSVGVECPRYV